MSNKAFATITPTMTSTLGLSGIDLILFAFIYSITQDGNTGKVIDYSAERLAQMWLGDKKRSRSVKDSLKVLTEAGLIVKTSRPTGKSHRNSYVSNLSSTLARIENGEKIMLSTRRRNKGGTVPPSSVRLPYHHDSGTVPPWNGGTESPIISGTVPSANIIEETMRKYNIKKARPESAEEKKEIFKILFFRNSIDPQAETDKLLTHFVLCGESLSTFAKRIVYAANKWDIRQTNSRCDSSFIDALREVYLIASANKDPYAENLLDTNLRCNPNFTHEKQKVYLIICSSETQRKWFQEHQQYLEPFDRIRNGHQIYYAIELNPNR